jgi:glycosyltransferase involved in cell wall biosynthesis
MTEKVFLFVTKPFRSMTKHNNTLVVLTPGFARDESDSTCIPMQQSFIRSLKKNHPQLNITVLAFQYPYFKKEYTWFGVNVISFSGKNKGGVSKLLLRQSVYATLKKINSMDKIVGLLSFWYGECALVGKRFADRHYLKHYCWIWGQDAKKENKYTRQIVPRPGELIAFSDFIQDEFEKNHTIRPMYVIPPGIDRSQFLQLTKERDTDILAAGSLIPLKQYNVFLELVAEIKNQLPHVKATLIGNGPEIERLQQLITKLKLQSTVTLTGELSHDEVLQLMQKSKVFLHPSTYEGFSGVCMEALYAGCHVISFCKAMSREIKQWQIVRSKEEMTARALAILQDGDPCFESVLTYSIDDTVKDFMTLI